MFVIRNLADVSSNVEYFSIQYYTYETLHYCYVVSFKYTLWKKKIVLISIICKLKLIVKIVVKFLSPFLTNGRRCAALRRKQVKRLKNAVHFFFQDMHENLHLIDESCSTLSVHLLSISVFTECF